MAQNLTPGEQKYLEDEVRVTEKEARDIERKTVGQTDNDQWKEERKKRLISSYFGEICKMRETTDRRKLVARILNPRDIKNIPNVQTANEQRPQIIASFAKEYKKQIYDSGLWIREDLYYLAANPIWLIFGEDALVQIKYHSSINVTPEEAIAAKHRFLNYLVTTEDGTYQLKHTHKYYYNIQGQLYICRKSKCYFICAMSKGMLVIEVKNEDDTFFLDKMKPKLDDFYFNYLLKEIVNSQFRPVSTDL